MAADPQSSQARPQPVVIRLEVVDGGRYVAECPLCGRVRLTRGAARNRRKAGDRTPYRSTARRRKALDAAARHGASMHRGAWEIR